MPQIIISGGGTGIGLAAARAYAADGARVVIIGRRPERVASAAKELNEECGEERVLAVAADLMDPAACDQILHVNGGTVLGR